MNKRLILGLLLCCFFISITAIPVSKEFTEKITDLLIPLNYKSLCPCACKPVCSQAAKGSDTDLIICMVVSVQTRTENST